MNILSLIGDRKPLFDLDLIERRDELERIIKNSSFLILGGAGSIGQAVVKEIFKRDPKKLHVVDISENNLVELVRDIRSSYGYISGDFKRIRSTVALLNLFRLLSVVTGTMTSY